MQRRIWAAASAMGAMAGGASAGGIVIDTPLGVADDDVWAYISAPDPDGDFVLSVWGSFDVDLNPEGFPGVQPGINFWSHAFMSWDLGVLPPTYRWGGATLTVTLASDTWLPDEGDAYVRFLSRGFDEATWSIFGNTPVPLPALGRITGDDSGATAEDDTITFEIPGDIDPSVFLGWFAEGRAALAVTADNAPPPPSRGGEPGSLVGALQIFSSEDIFGRGPTLTLKQGLLGDTDGSGTVDFTDLNVILVEFGQSGDGLQGDLNRDGAVDFSDLNEVVSQFGVSAN